MTVPDPALEGIGAECGLCIWRINKFSLECVPKEQCGNFYTGDSYVVLNTKSVGESAEFDVHFWLGNGTSQDEMGTAAIKTVELDEQLNGAPVQYREVQGHESSLFLSYFRDGIKYLDGGADTGFKHVVPEFERWTPRLFHCKGKRNVRCTQVKCAKESLNTGDVFILDCGMDLYVWMPPQSGRLERIKGMQQAKSIRDKERAGRPEVHVLDQNWNSSDAFWSHFGGCETLDWIKTPEAGGEDEGCWQRERGETTLWKCSADRKALANFAPPRVSDSSGKMEIAMVAQGNQNAANLDSKDAFMLDALSGGLFVWVGKECTLEERKRAMDWGQQYLAQQKRSNSEQIIRVLEGAEPEYFAQWFDDWGAEGRRQVGFQPRLYQCSDLGGRLRIEQIANFTQEDLDGDDVMILDALETIFVWVGTGANGAERDTARERANRYLQSGSAPRSRGAGVEVVWQAQEPPSFRKLFPEWDELMFPEQTRSHENMRKMLFQ